VGQQALEQGAGLVTVRGNSLEEQQELELVKEDEEYCISRIQQQMEDLNRYRQDMAIVKVQEQEQEQVVKPQELEMKEMQV